MKLDELKPAQSKEVRRRYRLTDDSEGNMTDKIEENLASVRLVKAFNNETHEINSFEKYITDFRNKYLNWRKLSAFFFASSDVFVFSQIALTTIFGFVLCFNNTISVGTLFVSFTFVNLMVWPVRDVATVLSNLARANASLDRINLILDEPLEDTDPDYPRYSAFRQDIVDFIKPVIKYQYSAVEGAENGLR